jgi:hypothetical protein
MKKIINITICIFSLFSMKAFSQDINEEDFFCCSVYELYKTSTKSDLSSNNNSENDVIEPAEIINIEADETFRDEGRQITILQGDTKIVRGTETN